MPRDVDEKKTRKALRKLRKAAERAELEGIELTDWEQEFIEGVDERLTKYGSAFADLSKGGSEEALSNAQSEILRQLDKKSRGKSTGGFKQRKPLKPKKGITPRKSELRDDLEIDQNPEEKQSEIRSISKPEQSGLRLAVSRSEPEVKKASELTSAPAPNKADRPARSPAFRVIDGGKT